MNGIRWAPQYSSISTILCREFKENTEEKNQMQRINLDMRSPNIGPIFVSSYQIGDAINSPWEPEAGNTATLRSGQVDILVKIDEAIGRSYKGTIIGFDSEVDVSYVAVQAGQSIEFKFEHLIGCSR